MYDVQRARRDKQIYVVNNPGRTSKDAGETGQMKGTAHRIIPKDNFGARRLETVERLRERLKGLRDLLETHEKLPFEKRDFKEILRIGKRIQSTRTGLRSAGEEIFW